MKLKEKYKNDIAFILAKRHLNGTDYWAAEDNNIGKGSPFSTKEVALILAELGFKKNDAIIKQIVSLIFKNQQADGRFRLYASGGIYPCHTIGCLRVLSYLGYATDKRLLITLNHILKTQEDDGGWKCNKFSFGKGPETNHSNPGPTLEALDILRFHNTAKAKQAAASALQFLLWHWDEKKPVGPCLFGIGSLFNKTEYPFLRYNLFYFVYVLSYFKKARDDKRFKQAFSLLESKLKEGKIPVENPNRQLANMDLCRKEQVSELATKRFLEIKKRLGV